MAKVILYIAQTADGYIAESNGSVSFLDQFTAGSEDYGYAKFLKSVGSIMMGRKSYNQLKTFGEWPYAKHKTYVFTSHVDAHTPRHIILTNSPIIQYVNAIKATEDKDIWLLGGAELVRSFLDAKLIDAMIITTVPLLLGGGIPLFHQSRHPVILELLDTKKFPGSIVQTTYGCLYSKN